MDIFQRSEVRENPLPMVKIVNEQSNSIEGLGQQRNNREVGGTHWKLPKEKRQLIWKNTPKKQCNAICTPTLKRQEANLPICSLISEKVLLSQHTPQVEK